MKGFFTEHPGLKLFSLALAVMLELYFYGPDNAIVASISARVEVKNLDPSLMIVSPPGAREGIYTKVRIRGPRPLVEQAKAGNYHFQVQMPNSEPSTFRAYLDPKQLRLPLSVDVEDIDPPMMELKVERVVEKKFLVVVDKGGEMPPGYMIDSITTNPETVSARGPVGELEGLQVVDTERVDLSQIRESVVLRRRLIPKGEFSVLSPTAVSIDIKVSLVPAERSIENVDVKVLAPEGYAATVEPSKVDVQIAGEKAALESLDAESLKLIADGTQLEPGKHAVTLSGELPTGLKIIKTSPAQVELTLIKAK